MNDRLHGVLIPLMNSHIAAHPAFLSESWEPDDATTADGGEASADRPPVRILMDAEDAPQPKPDSSDLARVEELLERCWRELDTADLNVKLTDVVRLLEFKARLRPSADAEAIFWSLINQLRREELSVNHEGESR